VTKPTNSMHRRSLPGPLLFKATRLPLKVTFQACANQTAGLMEQGSLLIGAKIQRSAGLAGRPSFDVAKHDHLAQGWWQLRNGRTRLFQHISVVDGEASAVPGGRRVRPVARPLRIVWG
jgi:hypothetical protein